MLIYKNEQVIVHVVHPVLVEILVNVKDSPVLLVLLLEDVVLVPVRDHVMDLLASVRKTSVSVTRLPTAVQ